MSEICTLRGGCGCMARKMDELKAKLKEREIDDLIVCHDKLCGGIQTYIRSGTGLDR